MSKRKNPKKNESKRKNPKKNESKRKNSKKKYIAKKPVWIEEELDRDFDVDWRPDEDRDFDNEEWWNS